MPAALPSRARTSSFSFLDCAPPRPALAAALTLSLLAPGCLGERGGVPLERQTDTAITNAVAGEKPYAKVREDVPLPLTQLLGHSPPEVEAMLGKPAGKGFAKKSCVRFAPERIFFRCEFALQTYADKTGNFDRILIEYEDGLSSRVAFNGLPGAGALTWKEALDIVGLELPKPPKTSHPGDDVTLWRWYNGAARLLIHDRQFRVEVSVVAGDRKRAKIDVILNHPLTPEQEAQTLEVERASPGTGELKLGSPTPALPVGEAPH